MKLFTLEERQKLLNDELRRIVQIIKNEYDPERIILFGSMAGKRIHEWSDIDLLVIKKTSKRLIDRTLEVGRLVHPRVGIDLFIYTPEEYELLLRERSSFLLSVLETGETVYEKRDGGLAEAREIGSSVGGISLREELVQNGLLSCPTGCGKSLEIPFC